MGIDSQDLLPLVQYNRSPAKALGTVWDTGHTLSQRLTYDAMSKVCTIHRSIAREFEVGLGILGTTLVVFVFRICIVESHDTSTN